MVSTTKDQQMEFVTTAKGTVTMNLNVGTK